MAGGKLGGYACGLAIKREPLRREQERAGPAI